MHEFVSRIANADVTLSEGGRGGEERERRHRNKKHEIAKISLLFGFCQSR